jgi:hypothetical protein
MRPPSFSNRIRTFSKQFAVCNHHFLLCRGTEVQRLARSSDIVQGSCLIWPEESECAFPPSFRFSIQRAKRNTCEDLGLRLQVFFLWGLAYRWLLFLSTQSASFPWSLGQTNLVPFHSSSQHLHLPLCTSTCFLIFCRQRKGNASTMLSFSAGQD